MPKGPKGEKRPGDVIGAAVKVMKIATGEIEDETTEDGKNKAAVELGRKGGAARALSQARKKGELVMPCYDLLVMADLRVLATVAADRESAVADFGKELNKRLSLNSEDDSVAPYLMDEWDGKGPHWVKPTIPVFEISD